MTESQNRHPQVTSGHPWAVLQEGNEHFDDAQIAESRPALWSHGDIANYLARLTRDGEITDAADRFVSLVSADTPNKATVGGMFASFGIIKPGETLARHRHTAAAMYYIVSGSGWSVINDTRIEWGPGDLFTCPAWTWHDHSASGDEPALQLVIQDMNMHSLLGTMLFQAADGSTPEPLHTVNPRPSPPERES